MYNNRAEKNKEFLNRGREKLLESLTREHICPHCDKKGKGSNMKRYHFNNCKFMK
jgi:hypothetical protein